MINTTRIREYIEDKDKTRKIREAIAQGHVSYGMQTFDQSLMALHKEDLISMEEALRQASNPDDFALRVRGVSSTSDLTWDDFDKDGAPTKE
jgi:twitching motility protein PilT